MLDQTEQSIDIHFLLSVIEQIPEILLIENLSHQFVYANTYTAKLFGYQDLKEMQGIDAHSMRCPASESAESFIQQDQQVIQTQKPINLLDIHEYADQQSRVLLTKKMPIFEGEKLKHILCHCREIDSKILRQISMKLLSLDQTITGKTASASYDIVHAKDNLSKREVEIMFFLLRGKTAPEIAEILFLSKRTIENHIANMKQKLQCHKKSEIIDHGINQGYLNMIPERLLQKNWTCSLD